MHRIINAITFRVKKAGQKLSSFAKPFLFKIIPAKVECNICGWRDTAFKTDGWHPGTVCPNCGSGVRQRLFWATINHKQEVSIDKLITGKKVLHMAPDACLTKHIAKKAREYITADLLTEGYQYTTIDLNIDMTNMKEIKEDEFDCVIAFDVLEHIPDHLQAIRETNRILKKSGFCIFTVPQKDNLEHTYEDTSITDPEKREQLFGQRDHFRIYGNDFKDMISRHGFDVSVFDEAALDKNIVERFVLCPPVLSKDPLATNKRKVYIGQKRQV